MASGSEWNGPCESGWVSENKSHAVKHAIRGALAQIWSNIMPSVFWLVANWKKLLKLIQLSLSCFNSPCLSKDQHELAWLGLICCLLFGAQKHGIKLTRIKLLRYWNKNYVFLDYNKNFFTSTRSTLRISLLVNQIFYTFVSLIISLNILLFIFTVSIGKGKRIVFRIYVHSCWYVIFEEFFRMIIWCKS